MDKNRKDFIKKSSLLTIGGGSLLPMPDMAVATPQFIKAEKGINIIGLRKGISPQLGILMSMMDRMRNSISMPVRDMTTEDLDYPVDDNADSIGAMLWHLPSTERFYQLHTFEGFKCGNGLNRKMKNGESPQG